MIYEKFEFLEFLKISDQSKYILTTHLGLLYVIKLTATTINKQKSTKYLPLKRFNLGT